MIIKKYIIETDLVFSGYVVKCIPFFFFLLFSFMLNQVGISITLQIWKDQCCPTSVLIFQE